MTRGLNYFIYAIAKTSLEIKQDLFMVLQSTYYMSSVLFPRAPQIYHILNK